MSVVPKKTRGGKKAAEAQLIAGGMLPVKSKVDEKTTEKVVARAYTGTALGDRKVVRLGAERLGPAEDLAMEFLGLKSAGESQPLAIQSRHALGFASWALITHPENAKDALVLVKRIKAAARKAKSKPGHAWDSFMEMAEELNRSVRHFLPPFWEEAARIFKELGNQTYAGRGLGKALEAERVHALDVDRVRRRDAVLEFALSGCLSGKALGEYTRDLESQFEPAEALETFRDLLVRRTLGGMPPMANAAKDLIRLAKGAGKDTDAEIDQLLNEIIVAPSMARAPNQFWKSVSKRVAHLVKQSDSFGVWLLVHTNCESNYYSESTAWRWVDQLEQWDVLRLLTLPVDQFPRDVEIPGGRAGWFSRLALVSTPPQKRYFDLLESAADALRDEGIPIQLGKSQGWRSVSADVDVIEACLDLKIPLADVPENAGLGFTGWLQAEPDHPRRNSSLVHVLDDQRYAAKVRNLIPSLVCGEQTSRRYGNRQGVGERRFDQAAAGHKAIRDLWWAFLDHELKTLENGALADFETTLNRVRTGIGRSTLESFPKVLARLQKLDIVAVLQRTIVGGVLDEYGWKALDDVDDEDKIPTVKKRQQEGATNESFPTVTLARNGNIEVVGPSGHKVFGEYSFSKTQESRAVIPVCDDVAVIYRDVTIYESKLLWLSEPKNAKKFDGGYWYSVPEFWMPYEDGVFFGKRLIKPGDTNLPQFAHWMSDGKRFWTLKVNEHSYYVDPLLDGTKTTPSLQEIDPVTGKRTRESVPDWFEPDLDSNSVLHWKHCFLMPVPSGLDQSPLGMKDRMIAWSTLTKRDGSKVGRGTDGRTCTLTADSNGFEDAKLPVAMMDKPGSDGHWIITDDGTVIDSETGLGIAMLQEKSTRYRMGQTLNLSYRFYNLHSVRCKTSSAKLRKVSAKQSKLLLTAGAAQHEALRKKKEEAATDPNRDAVEKAVAKWLPKAPERLQIGLRKIVSMAAAEQASLNAFVTRITAPPKEKVEDTKPGEKAKFAPSAGGIGDLVIPWGGSNRPNIYSHRSNGTPKAHIEVVTNFLETGNQQKIPGGGANWISVIDDPCSAAWKWFWNQSTVDADLEQTQNAPAKSRFEETDGLKGLAYLAKRGILDWKGKFVYYIAKAFSESDAKLAKNKPFVPSSTKPIAFVDGKHRYVAYQLNSYREDEIHVLEYVEAGKPKPPKPYTIIETIPLKRTWDSKSVSKFVEAVRNLESLPHIDPELLEEAAKDLGASPVQVGIAWMADLRTNPYGQEKLTKEVRGHYGWKVNEIKTAISGLESESIPLSLLSKGLLENPDGAIGARKNEAFGRVIAAWKKRRESKVMLSPTALAQLEHVGFGYPRLDRTALLGLLSSPSESGVLDVRKTTFQYSSESNRHQRHILDAKYTPKPPIELNKVLPQLLDAIGWINYATPFGDPARRRIPGLIEATRQWLDAPSTTMPFGATYTTPDFYGDKKLDIEATVDRFSKQIAPCKKQKTGHYEFDGGLVLGAIFPPICRLHFRSSKLRSLKDLAALAAAGKITFGYETDGSEILGLAEFVLDMRSETADELLKWNQSDALPDGTWEHDPRVSSPDVVAEAAKRFKISEDTATLYLQILALPDPTSKQVQAWNGWKPAEYKKRTAELVEKGLVVSAKRSRAGRDIFLPGGWEALKLPNIPVESWKLPMYGLSNTDRLRGGNAALLVCRRPVAAQFRFAFDRVKSGDEPRYEDTLQT